MYQQKNYCMQWKACSYAKQKWQHSFTSYCLDEHVTIRNNGKGMQLHCSRLLSVFCCTWNNSFHVKQIIWTEWDLIMILLSQMKYKNFSKVFLYNELNLENVFYNIISSQEKLKKEANILQTEKLSMMKLHQSVSNPRQLRWM